MSKRTGAAILLLVALAYWAGSWRARRGAVPQPAGAAQVDSERRQIQGVRVARIERTASTYTIRAPGRIVADENRIYRINVTVEGWIGKTFNDSVGTLVSKDEVLASFYAAAFLGAQQSYIFQLNALGEQQASHRESNQQINQAKASVQQAADTLLDLGMGALQLEEIRRTRKPASEILVRSPVTGFVVARDLSPGQRFDSGTEFYRIVDLNQVWILADIPASESQYFRPRSTAQIRTQRGTTLTARVSEVPPLFDPTTRTLKVRLEAQNPAYLLRPDMFVDVQLSIELPPALVVPADAVLDSGLTKTVFVQAREGVFEPRQVKTGWRFGDRVEIVSGLMEGERIVLSSSFLLDSESRLRPAKSASGTVTDPVCGMEVQTAAAGGNRSSYRGTTYYFCSEKCKRQFDRNPARYLPPPAAAVRQRRQTGVPPVIAQSSPVEEEPDREVVASAERQDSASRAVAKNPATTPPATNPLEDPVCGGVVDEAKARAEGRVSQFMGRTYFFSAERCKQEFDKTPLRYAGSTDSPDPETDTGEAPGSAAPARHDSRRTGGKDNPQ